VLPPVHQIEVEAVGGPHRLTEPDIVVAAMGEMDIPE
jgi:hypothetical protein